MLLYHGSNIDIKEIDLAMCRPYKDFGKGFYLTVMKDIPYRESPSYVFGLLQDEINFGHIVQAEV